MLFPYIPLRIIMRTIFDIHEHIMHCSAFPCVSAKNARGSAFNYPKWCLRFFLECSSYEVQIPIYSFFRIHVLSSLSANSDFKSINKQSMPSMNGFIVFVYILMLIHSDRSVHYPLMPFVTFGTIFRSEHYVYFFLLRQALTELIANCIQFSLILHQIHQ